ncbi:MAG: hypothetical protein E7016_02660 [Alphaproteobacteria bacterium]|nr:hypothetical protein [Alphaproteobacteria bacterium]
MRKYFLLFAVALLVTSNVNATTDYAEVTAKATIEVANKIECSNLNFGKIVVKKNNEATTVISTPDDGMGDEVVLSKDILSHTGMSSVYCEDAAMAMDQLGYSFPPTVTLTGTGGNLTAKLSSVSYGKIEGQLSIPNNVTGGDYTGSFTVSFTYE